MNGKYYRKHILFQEGRSEVLEVDWPVGAKSDFHDHGVSSGRIIVVCGKIFQKVHDKKTKKFLFQKVYGPGEVILETPDIIHQMGNASKSKPAKSIHVYLPPLDTMMCYDLRSKKVWMVRREDFEEEKGNDHAS
jgi:predicted metal-dependent enzyme (double-stranded beta helix superfamily)